VSAATETAMKPALMRVADAATYLGLSDRQIRYLAEDGVLERRWVGKRQYRITTTSLDAYVAGLPEERPHD
jgi:excisionase family DNA binding protein